MKAHPGRARPPGAPQHRIRKKLPHDVPLWVSDEAVWFVTICTLPRGENQLCHRDAANELFETMEFRNERGDWFVTLALLMPDHLHFLVSFPPDAVLRKVIAQWKEISAKKLGVQWQRDFFDHRLRRDESLREKWDYIRLNPVRAGLIGSVEDWPYVWTPCDRETGRALPLGAPLKTEIAANNGAASGRALPVMEIASINAELNR